VLFVSTDGHDSQEIVVEMVGYCVLKREKKEHKGSGILIRLRIRNNYEIVKTIKGRKVG
jgi:hypothetical protein